MANPAFAGEVQCTIYFGTLYDDLNVPYANAQIENEATKKIEVQTAVVWQTTWLSTIRINVESYQDIVGAQYVKIVETVPEMLMGAHWYTVVGYVQVSNKTVELGLLYDPLLTIGIFNIKTINGTLRRWSVADDTPWKYAKSEEPLSQIDKYDYSYFRYRCDNSSGSGTRTTYPLVGFPCDLTIAPIVTKYVHPDETTSEREYTKVMPASISTIFNSSIGIDGSISFVDNLLYHEWNMLNLSFSTNANYDALIGLGVNMPHRGYMLPSSDLIEIGWEDPQAIYNRKAILITADTQYVNNNIPLRTENGYNNAKTADIGNIFQLYNEISGDLCEINGIDMDDTDLIVMVNPYWDGFFAARFASYYHSTGGYAGLVKSAGYQEFNPVSSNALGATLRGIENAIAIESVNLTHDNQQRLLDASRENANRSNLFALGDSLAGGLSSVRYGNGGGTLSSIANMIGAGITEQNSVNLYNTNVQNLNNTRALQLNHLNVMGNIGKLGAPPVKMLGSSIAAANAYTFVVRKSSLSDFDRRRLDRFFTAYGYNVDSEILNSPAQLATRSRFTFVMADNVNILAQNSSDEMTRIRDWMTVQSIRERFSSGLRIWKVTPDYDWTIPNPIGG